MSEPPSTFPDPSLLLDERARDLPPPPVSPDLLAELSRMGPVKTRRPGLAVALVVAVGLLVAVTAVLTLGPRPDLPFLALGPYLVLGAGWLTAFLVAAVVAVLPRRDAVLPDGVRALRVAVVSAVLLALGLVVAAPYAPGHTVVPEGTGALWKALKCLSIGLLLGTAPVALGALALRRIEPVGAWRLGAALGLAGGTLGALVLHVHCKLGGAFHLLGGHGGAVVVGAAIGALVLDRFDRR